MNVRFQFIIAHTSSFSTILWTTMTLATNTHNLIHHQPSPCAPTITTTWPAYFPFRYKWHSSCPGVPVIPDPVIPPQLPEMLSINQHAHTYTSPLPHTHTRTHSFLICTRQTFNCVFTPLNPSLNQCSSQLSTRNSDLCISALCPAPPRPAKPCPTPPALNCTFGSYLTISKKRN